MVERFSSNSSSSSVVSSVVSSSTTQSPSIAAKTGVVPKRSLRPTVSYKIPDASDRSSSSSKRIKPKTFRSNRNPTKLIWRDIYVEVKEQRPWWKCKRKEEDYQPKVVLDQISGVAEPGEVTFLMGSTGAGKTTLLNILTQRARGLKIYGEVQVNSYVMKPGEMRKISAFVPKEDVLVGALTVKETLQLTARLRLPEKTSSDDRKKRIEHIVKEMSLTSCFERRVDSLRSKAISRGERKRLALACEMITDPSIVFLDEPMSGLDPLMALQMMKTLCILARAGKTVICSIQQPSSQIFEMAHRLILLVNGQIAYQGPISEVEPYLKGCALPVPRYVSIPDHFMKIMFKGRETEEAYTNRTKRVFMNYKTSGYANQVHNETHVYQAASPRARMRLEINNPDFPASWWSQFVWLLWRCLKVALRDPRLLRIRLVQCIVISLIVGIFFVRLEITKESVLNAKGLSFSVVRDMNLMFLIPGAQAIMEEIHIVYREYQMGMVSSSAYFLAKQVIDGAVYLLLSSIYSIFVYWMAGFEYSGVQFLFFWLIAFLQSMVAASFGYASACIFGSLRWASFFSSIVCIPMMIFTGFYLNLGSVPYYLKPFGYFSWHRFGFEANIVNIFGRLEEEIEGCGAVNGTIPQGIDSCMGRTGPEIMYGWNIETDLLWLHIVAMLLSSFAWRVVALCALWLRVRRY